MNIKIFKYAIKKIIDKNRVIDNKLIRIAYSADASLYQMVPKLVVIVKNAQEVKSILILANKYNVKITFRAAGTSLSGQAVTDSVLLVLSNSSWQNYKILLNGQKISLEPGIIGSYANKVLKPYQKKIGPDPASINSCKIGGIAANNASGMCCGTIYNSYHTLADIKLILVNKDMLDTGSKESRQKFQDANLPIIQGIINIRKQIWQDMSLVSFIKNKFNIKNTSSYNLNAFIDFEEPIDILAHLLIGSEGTLGFISEITYNCIDDKPYKAVSLVFFENISQLMEIIIKFNTTFNNINQLLDAVELLDISSLLSIKNLSLSKPYLPILSDDTSAVLLEVSANNQEELNDKVTKIQNIINQYKVYSQIHFTCEEKLYNDLWSLRKGLLSTIGAERLDNSTLIIEDIAVSIDKLPKLIEELRKLFSKYNYNNTAIFGHVLAGNIHFIFTPLLINSVKIQEYDLFMHDLVDLVVNEFNGSLKAEHGCGRNIAPFVELEWGKAAYEIMWQIKNLLDPKHILNPDVILTKNLKLHVQNFKKLRLVEPIIDKCIECGFCESVCPSINFTLTPRQRIIVYRYLQQFKNQKKYASDYKKYAIDSCATTGMCAVKCPVAIDTGKFMLKLKERPSNLIVKIFSRYFNWLVNISKVALSLANKTQLVLGKKALYTSTMILNKNIRIMPVCLPNLPKAQQTKFVNSNLSGNVKQIMYIPSCNNRILNDSTNSEDNSNALQKLIKILGYEIVYPPNLENLCCGQLFSSQGYIAAANEKLQQFENELKKYNLGSIIIDNSSCYYNLLMQLNNKYKIIDIVTFIAEHLEQLNLKQKYNKLALHIDCSSFKIGNEHIEKVKEIVAKCSQFIDIPDNIFCCGFAGIKGFTLPKFNEAALIGLKDKIKDCEIGVTMNRNCQIGLSNYGAKEYLSLAEIVLNCYK